MRKKTEKEKLRQHFNMYDINDNLLELAEAYLLIQKIFKLEDFSISQYAKYKQKNS